MNLLTNDKQFAALHLPPKAPTSNKNKSSVNEGREILFQARNVLKTHDNPSLMYLGTQHVLGPLNSTNTVEDVHDSSSKLEAQMKRKQANRVYSARYRLRKQAKAQNLKSQAEALEGEISMFQSQLLYWKSVHDRLVEENVMMRAQCDTATKLIAEKEVKAMLKLLRKRKTILESKS
ncbi:unnamed protein product [Sphenostylis stenocarpa]|uniref:BZIP domain-containing protein n=1 Tax=Sphenostylis stenocarpa TaxID=92480 RepID=A0AA86VAZ9_9FABA|nr:unnamed protein product [Sphenostylis stenocarpa]